MTTEHETIAVATASDEVAGERAPVRRRLVDGRWSLFAALVVLNLLDVVTTKLVLDRGGTERNPFVRPFAEGMWDITAMKVAVLAIVGSLLLRCRGSRRVEVALAVTTGWYLAVVTWNLAVLALQ